MVPPWRGGGDGAGLDTRTALGGDMDGARGQWLRRAAGVAGRGVRRAESVGGYAVLGWNTGWGGVALVHSLFDGTPAAR
ncbi:hypothetical protein GCM10010345_87260 [Streptomyces canarius]|uniref:Uncharacterized protein n=1 Tax=Streptomyces canarius TaxID=285453 RepID=A0ABQ3DBB4_9ACTN|nr:hypothetical protein GCM10010345_87260 [Streptomyces canarius]